MMTKEDKDALVSIDSNITNENMISKVFGHFLDV